MASSVSHDLWKQAVSKEATNFPLSFYLISFCLCCRLLLLRYTVVVIALLIVHATGSFADINYYLRYVWWRGGG